MVSQSLVAYVNSAFDGGLEAATIKRNLVAMGWEAGEVAAAIRQVEQVRALRPAEVSEIADVPELVPPAKASETKDRRAFPWKMLGLWTSAVLLGLLIGGGGYVLAGKHASASEAAVKGAATAAPSPTVSSAVSILPGSTATPLSANSNAYTSEENDVEPATPVPVHSAAPVATPTPTATPTPMVTATPAPTATPTSTPMPAVTPSSTPGPTATPSLLPTLPPL